MQVREGRVRGAGLAVGLMAVVGFLQAGCDAPVEIGSDLLAEAPPAVLDDQTENMMEQEAPVEFQGAPAVDTQVEGRFEIAGALDNPLGGTIEVNLLGVASQDGELGDPAATIDLEILTDEDEADGARFEMPALLDATGAFSGRVVDFVLQKEFSALLAEDSFSDLYFDGRITSEDCFHGTLGLQLKDARIEDIDAPLSIRLDGRFTATRNGAHCEHGPGVVDQPSATEATLEEGDAQ